MNIETMRSRTPYVSAVLPRIDEKRQSTSNATDNAPSQQPHPTAQLSKPRLLRFEELPPWQQDNHYITSQYRPVLRSYWRCFQSLIYTHNESINIWTHLLGAIIFPTTGLYLYLTYFSLFPTFTYADAIALSCFFLGATICLGMSATYHCISCHSHRVCVFGNSLDYLGIVSLISGSFVPMVYYGFYCEPRLQKLYWGLMSLTGLACATVSLRPSFRTPQWRPFRASMFVAMGLSSVVAVIHGCFLFGPAQFNRQIRWDWMVAEGGLYILGAGLYAARVPERFRPGAFDLWGASHQIFHTLVLCAAACHLVGVCKAFEYAHTYRGSCHIQSVDYRPLLGCDW